MAARPPARAGEFYEAEPEELRETIEACFLGPFGPGRIPAPAPFATGDVVALVNPHAGLRYSGYAAAWSFLELAEDGLPDTVVIIGPNHFGRGAAAAVMASGQWETPLGIVDIDEELARGILGSSEYLREDAEAHRMEHSLEVQVPFLQYIAGSKVKIVPIVVAHLTWEDARVLTEDLGRAMAQAMTGKQSVIVASTDFSHYEPKDFAEKQDHSAIHEIEELDAGGLLDVVRRQDISMCGAVPVAVTLRAARELGAARGELLKYYTSGDIIGDMSQVVGYGSLKIIRGK